jgi:hypothetical protein
MRSSPVTLPELSSFKVPIRLRKQLLWSTTSAADHRDAEGDGSPSVSALIVMFDGFGFGFGFGPGRPNSGHRKAAICKRNCPD